jgi:hypothetical protein
MSKARKLLNNGLASQEKAAVNTTSKLDLASAEARQNRRAQQVLETRPMSLEELPHPARADRASRANPVLQSQRTALQRSLF